MNAVRFFPRTPNTIVLAAAARLLSRPVCTAVIVVALILAVALPGCGAARLPDPDVVYIAFGDSATAGPGERDYPDILADRLDLPVDAFANEGRGGEVTAEGIERLRGLLATEIYPNAQALLYWQGGTDLVDLIQELDPLLARSPNDGDYPYVDELADELDRIEDNIAEAIGIGRNHGLDVYVATYFPMREAFGGCPALPLDVIVPGQAQRANAYTELLNERIRSAARDAGAALVDVADEGARITADPEHYENCNHLSAAGNAIVAEVFADALASH